MRKIMIGALILSLVIGWAAAPARRSQAAPSYDDNGITMAAPSVEVEPEITQATRQVLGEFPNDRGVRVFAITNVDQDDSGAYYFVSVAGFPEDIDPGAWHLDQAIYLGLVTLTRVEGIGLVGMFQDDPMTEVTDPAEITDSELETGKGGSGDILPFRDDTRALYGILGVHNCGFGLTGWSAVDFFPDENMIFAAQAGEISYICRDSAQVSVRIGDHLYAHLQDYGQAQGDYYEQGQALGGTIYGSQNGPCGYTDQSPSSAHVHYCFRPDSGYYFADGYTLSLATGAWTKGEETVNALGYLTADWQDASVIGPIPGGVSTVGANLWDGMIGGMLDFLGLIIPVLPAHQAMGIADRVMSVATVALQVVYVIVLTNFDMTVPIFCLTIWFVLEAARIVYAGWMYIKRAIPVVG